ncbi:MAG TPA: hypothetical protein VG675_05185 [Bryobacteraceae bacterium]|jgi:hypothetical protein|nr:hypothetical protein [Bryobacteraceae bacterium]
MPLDEAIEKTTRIYEREHRHAAPVDAVAQSIGYSGAKNGAALQALASLRYYGLVERPGDGQVQVSKDFESYSFAPDEKLKQELRIKWLKSPPIFSELLERFPGELPSDPTLKFTLIQRGFTPTAADECVTVFRKSAEFARYYQELPVAEEEEDASVPPAQTAMRSAGATPSLKPPPPPASPSDIDRIPVRLSGNRRAWIEIPLPFFEADKDRLKAQIDLFLTDDEVHEGEDDDV